MKANYWILYYAREQKEINRKDERKCDYQKPPKMWRKIKIKHKEFNKKIKILKKSNYSAITQNKSDAGQNIKNHSFGIFC